MRVPPPDVRPLDKNDGLIRLLCEATGESRRVVVHRLIDEEACLGTSVRCDLKNAGVRPHVWSDQLVDFYRTTRSFLYETSVWNRASLKLKMRDWIGRFLAKRACGRGLKVLSFGDGLGFDSVYLAAAGHYVTYCELADQCVPFARWLTPGGWLLAHSPFFFNSWHRVTHLKSSRKYSSCKELYRQRGLHPVDGRFFRDPIALKKASLPPKNGNLSAVNFGGLLLMFGRHSNAIHCAIAQMKAGTDRRWRDDLVQRFQATESV